MSHFKCPNCDEGLVRPFAGPGRTCHYYERNDLSIPDDFEIPTCDTCGTEWLDGPTTKELDGVLGIEYYKPHPFWWMWFRGPRFENLGGCLVVAPDLESAVQTAIDKGLHLGGEAQPIKIDDERYTKTISRYSRYYVNKRFTQGSSHRLWQLLQHLVFCETDRVGCPHKRDWAAIFYD